MGAIEYKNFNIGRILNITNKIILDSHNYHDNFFKISNWFVWLDEDVKKAMHYGRFDFDNEGSARQELIRQFDSYLDFIAKIITSNQACVRAFDSSTGKEVEIETACLKQPEIFSSPTKIDIFYNGFRICSKDVLIQENYIDMSFIANNRQFDILDKMYFFPKYADLKDVARVVTRKFEMYCNILLRESIE